MNKKLSILSVAMAPAFAMAAATNMAGSTTVQTDACTLLQDNLTIQLSSGVAGAYNCNTTTNTLSIAACHTAGRVADRNQNVPAPLNCSGTGASSCTGTMTANVSGAVVPNASTEGGSMGMYFAGGGSCDATGSTAAAAIP